MGGFQKRFIHTFDELAQIPISQRHHYYLARPLLAAKTDFTHQDEPLVTRGEIESAGIVCQPFWEEDAEQLDAEGEETRRYQAQHPEFDLALRKTAFQRLLAARDNLPESYRIVLKASVRPVQVQKNLFQKELENIHAQNPDMTKKQAYEYTLQFVTDPEVNTPPHSSGGTIDITLLEDSSNQPIDMGSPINMAGDVSWTDCTDDLTDAQVENRQLLTQTMLEAGFANLPSEWWHYSYGDQRWAVFYDVDPLYERAEL
jgi:D-alanyl-D-alanine dipeptidase